MDRRPCTRPRWTAVRIAAAACGVVGLLLRPTGPLGAQQGCAPLPPPTGAVVDVGPAQAGALRDIVAGAASGTTVRLADGTYDLGCGDAGCRLVFATPNVTLRSASGNRDAVVLDGEYGTNELVSIYASGITVADLTLRRAFDHPIHASGGVGSPISGLLIHNVRIVDPGQQGVKVNPDVDGYVDFSTIQCSAIELTDVGRTHVRDSCYTGGIDVHQARGWVVRRNHISGFWCDDGLSEHGIHFWKGCRDTVVEENLIVDCARGIGFGLGDTGAARVYPDDPYPGVPGLKGHIDGVIRNNFVAASSSGLFASPDGFDSGISLEQAYGAEVVHNSVASTQAPLSSSIEWRFANSVIGLHNNLATSVMIPRNGGTASASGNIASVSAAFFTDVPAGDLHLTAAAGAAVDAGSVLPAGLADTDFDGSPRDGAPDVGADELTPALVFADGFEDGTTDAWTATIP